MMNSSYGRFGLNVQNTKTIIANPETARTIAAAFPIIRVINFTNGYELIEFEPQPYPGIVESVLVSYADINPYIDSALPPMETNVPIAAAITANSRMIINQYKIDCIKLGIDVIYSDTDSLITQSEIPSEWLHKTEFVKFKLEHTIVDGYFLAPKLYSLECLGKDGTTYRVSKNKGYSGKITLEQAITLYQGGS